ncbi:hypothetical protein [Rhizobium sp. MHM7A]|uniref:hypothetical protein n=1 Tax=Rhizobium sp. MHM7A TaxID=2583233 RepID=UPI00110648B0|nr:hypothetical protein [Rhizobium sp. MHM7A]
MLVNLGQSGGEWYSGCGRHWYSPRQDTQVYRTLVARGYVEEREIVLHRQSTTLFRMTRAGREWYFTRTGKRVQRHPFAKVTDPYEEGEFLEDVSPGSATQDVSPVPDDEFDDYSVRDDGIQGWTVSSQIDSKDRRIIGNRKVWWVSQWGFDEAKRLAEQHADWLNDDGSFTGPAIAVPIMIAPFGA